MGQIPRLKRTPREDYPEAPEWFGRYLDTTSPFFGEVSGALGGQLDRSNLRKQLEPMVLTTAASLEATFAGSKVGFKNRLGVAPKKVALAKCNPAVMPTFAQETWQTPTFLNSWVNYDTSAYFGAAYRLEAGRVFIRGLIKNGTINTDAFILPVGFRPANNIVFPANAAGNTHGSGRVLTTGGVRPAAGAVGDFNIDCSFEPAPGTWTGIGPFGPPIWDVSSAGLIRIRYIAGLSPLTKYELTFEVE